MEAVRTGWSEADRVGTTVALLGLAIAVLGLTFQDTLGATSTLVAAGLALLVAGAAYAATDGSKAVRFAVGLVALVAAQLLAFGGVLRWIGGMAMGAAVVAAVFSRRSGA